MQEERGKNREDTKNVSNFHIESPHEVKDSPINQSQQPEVKQSLTLKQEQPCYQQ